VHTLDEEDFPFSPIASSFVFGEHNNSVEFSQRGGRSGIPRAVGPIVQEFTSSNFELLDFQETMSNLSEGSHTYSLESGFLELGTSNRVFNGYIEINHSGRFSIDLQRGPRLERHQGWSAAIEKTPDVLLRIVEEASSMSHRRRSNATKYGCFSTCRCLVRVFIFSFSCDVVCSWSLCTDLDGFIWVLLAAGSEKGIARQMLDVKPDTQSCGCEQF
jgi:hypothetical protein